VKSLRRRAARQLSAVPGEEAVADRRSVARLSWAFAVLASGVILYQLLAPKSLLTSAARIVAPWTGVSPPARVWIEPPRLSWRQPGEAADVVNRDQRLIPVIDGVAEIVRGRQLVVETEIDGLAEGEKPTLLVTPRAERTGGEAIPGWQVPLAAAAGQWRRCVLPDDDRGLDYPVDLVIKAGDARSGPLRVAVVDAPSLLVREVRYEYPAYMRRESETLPWQGDIRGVEGTRVTIVAQANRPLHSAGIDLGSDGRRDVALTISGKDRTIGEGSFVLRLDPDRKAAEFGSYRFAFRSRSEAGGPSADDLTGGLEYRIEVIPDLAPEVEIEVPAEKVLAVPPDAPVTVRVKALDPDFGLASVRVETRLAGGDPRSGGELLVGDGRMNFRGAETLIPSELGGRPGSVLEYRAVATDSRPDEPNRTVTDWQTLKIDASAP
ncbi:MAG: hypothetical protein NZ658_09245, partial [Pirellulales bacterium]|nr:hypothetical protein [Pirellulales bacterium]